MTMVLSGDGTVTGLVAGGLPDATVQTADIMDAAITPAKLSGGQSGSAPVFGVRAWCTFNGITAGTNAPTSGGNVSTVQKHGTGDYTVTFTTALPDGAYALFGAVGTTNLRGIISVTTASTNLTSATARFNVFDPQTSVNVDEAFVSVCFVR